MPVHDNLPEPDLVKHLKDTYRRESRYPDDVMDEDNLAEVYPETEFIGSGTYSIVIGHPDDLATRRGKTEIYPSTWNTLTPNQRIRTISQW